MQRITLLRILLTAPALTAWFRAAPASPDELGEMKAILKTPLLVNLRNIYPRDEAEKAGITIVGIGPH